jgi:hypothetical protein
VESGGRAWHHVVPGEPLLGVGFHFSV